MTMNSIEYITQKHFRSPTSLLVTLVSLAIAALSVWIAVVGEFNPAAVGFSVFTVTSAFFTVIRVFSVKTGCRLMRLSVAFTAVFLFFTAMGMFTVSYLLIRHPGTLNRLNEMLSGTGWIITTSPGTTGALLFMCSVVLYYASGCAFFCHRYLGAVKSCSAGDLKRSGLRVFPLLSALLFLLAAGCIAVFVSFSNGLISEISSDPVLLLNAVLAGLVLLHSLLAGICARFYARKTFAFKVFEHQIMKVETNADGTVYVPINEDHAPDAEEPLQAAKSNTADEEKHGGKAYIREIPPAPLHDDKIDEREPSEGDIL